MSAIDERPFATLAVLGLGVMGGSLAQALSALSPRPRVVGWSPDPAERRLARDTGAVIEAPDDWRDAVGDVEIVVLAAPLEASCALLAEVAREAGASTVIIDVASLKVPLAEAAMASGASNRWVGCHPMAGSEASGFGASTPGLYQSARVWTVASAEARHLVPRVHGLWRSLGARPEEIGAEAHDRLMALASHLPQLASNALASVLMEAGLRPDQLGPGGRDTTRLAGSSADLWKDLLGYASPDLAQGLRELSSSAGRIADLLERHDVEAIAGIMRSTRHWRQS